MAAVLDLLGGLRRLIERAGVPPDRANLIRHGRAIEGLWADLANLLDEQRQAEVAWFDSAIKKIDDVLAATDDHAVIARFIDLGMKVRARRADVLKLDARAVIGTMPLELVDDLVDMRKRDEESDDLAPPMPGD